MGFLSRLSSPRKCEIAGVFVLAVTAVLFLALATDRYQGETSRSLTDLGAGGSMLAGALYLLLGRAAHILYILTGAWGVMLLRHQPLDRMWTRILGFFLVTTSAAGFLQTAFDTGEEPGGMVGAFIVHLLHGKIGTGGLIVATLTCVLIGTLLATEFLFIRLLHWCWSSAFLVLHSIEELRSELAASIAAWRERRQEAAKVITLKPQKKGVAKSDAAETPEPARSLLKDTLSLFFSKKRKVRAAVEKVRRAHAASGEASLDDRISITGTAVSMTRDHEATVVDAPEVAAVSVDTSEQLEFEGDEQAGAVYVSSRPETGATRLPSKNKVRRRTYEEELPPDYQYPKRYTRPPMDLFDPPKSSRPRKGLDAKLKETALLLEDTLQTFGIEAKVTDIVHGPTITRFELEPAQGIKVSRFVALADDLALALRAHGIRIEAPIPGKGRVGIEIPNEHSEPVMLRELIESSTFKNAKGALHLAMGKDITGEVIAADMATMPHLLVAGATGSGKTVFVKTVLASLLASKTPDELQLILIDPKMVELSIFNDIPHLITPVVIDPRKASVALGWLIHEMEQRYELFTQLRVRNIDIYNEIVENGEIEVTGDDGEEGVMVESIRKLPYIVCIIDELADLMMLARAEVEDAIFRLAQLARAVGIHLIIATQRPSVDVLTGVIKANLPARVSFQVSSKVDSRCILEEMGAERLLGRGDMLFRSPGGKPRRVQSGFVSDDEMNDLIAYLKTQAPPQYRDEIENYGKKQETQFNLENEDDELFDDAVRIVTDTGQASISMIQRRLRVGYTRAARLIDMMELKGIVGPHLGSKAREILIPTQHETHEVA